MIPKIIEEDMQRILREDIPWSRLYGKTVLITGATGMLPSYMVYLLAYLNEQLPDAKIRILAAARSEAKLRHVFGAIADRPYFRWLNMDLAKDVQCPEHLDYIIHGASPANTQSFCTDPAGTFLPNVIGTHGLLELARRDNSEGFLFFSSGSVYGSTGVPIINENIPGVVDSMLISNSYAEGKRAGEMLCAIWNSQYLVPTKSARIYHSFGPTIDLANDRRSFADFIRNVLDSSDIVLKSDGSAIRPFCYISDTTAALFYILLKGTRGESYNVCNHNGYLSIAELAELVAALFPEKNLKVIRSSRQANDTYVERPAVKIVDNGKLRKLGWEPRITVAEGFKRTIQSKS